MHSFRQHFILWQGLPVGLQSSYATIMCFFNCLWIARRPRRKAQSDQVLLRVHHWDLHKLRLFQVFKICHRNISWLFSQRKECLKSVNPHLKSRGLTLPKFPMHVDARLGSRNWTILDYIYHEQWLTVEFKTFSSKYKPFEKQLHEPPFTLLFHVPPPLITGRAPWRPVRDGAYR